MLVTDSVSFCSSENVLICSSSLKEIFAEYRILSRHFSQQLEICSFLLNSLISDGRFAGGFQNFLFGSLVFRCLTIMFLGVDFFGFILFGVYSALNL